MMFKTKSCNSNRFKVLYNSNKSKQFHKILKLQLFQPKRLLQLLFRISLWFNKYLNNQLFHPNQFQLFNNQKFNQLYNLTQQHLNQSRSQHNPWSNNNQI